MQKLRIKILFLLVSALFHSVFSDTGFAAEITNATVTQLDNRILLEFDVEGNEPQVEVDVVVSIGAEKYASNSLHLEGDIGKVAPGSGKKVYWNVLKDFPRGFTGEIQWEILAYGKSGVQRTVVAKPKTLQTTGMIEDLDMKAGTFSVKNKRETVTLNVAGNVNLADFHVGDKVVVKYEGENATYIKLVAPGSEGGGVQDTVVGRPKTLQITGTIAELDARAGTFTVKGKRGMVDLEVQEGTALSDFHIGDKVVVKYEGKMATYIKLLAPKTRK